MHAQNVVQKGIDLLSGFRDSAASSQVAGGFQDLLTAVTPSPEPAPPAQEVSAPVSSNTSETVIEHSTGQAGIWEPVSSYSSPETARAKRALANDMDVDPEESETVLSSETPIERFLRILKEQGIDLERLVLKSGERQRLQKLLEASGFKSDVARQIMDRASDASGNVSISELIGVLGQYEPTEGPLFTISPEDRPLLVQFLGELGMDTASVNEYLDSLPMIDGRIQVRGLGQLLANAGQLAREVDLDRLGDFLGRLGMSGEDIRSLLMRHTDQEGKLSPEGALEIFKAVSSRQELATGSQSAEDINLLLKQVQVNAPKLDNFNEAQMKASVSQSLKEAMPDPAAETLPEDEALGAEEEFLEQVKDKLKAAEHPGEANSRSGARSEALHESAAKAATESGSEQGSGQRGKAMEQALAATARSQASQRSEGASAETRQDGETPGLGLGAAGGKGAPAQAAGSRPTLPAYVARQVGTQMAQMIKQGDQVLRLTLRPAELGGVKMELSVEQSVIKASLTVDTVTAKNTLEAGLEQLRQNLAQQGFKVERIEVTVNPENQDQHQQAQAGEQGAGRKGKGASSGSGLDQGADGAAAGESSADDDLALAAVSSSRISLFA